MAWGYKGCWHSMNTFSLRMTAGECRQMLSQRSTDRLLFFFAFLSVSMSKIYGWEKEADFWRQLLVSSCCF
jgi:hypothetical protein